MSSCEHIPDTNGTNMRPSDHCAKNGLTDRSEKMKLFILILDWTQAENEFKTDLRDLHQRLLKASSWAGFVMSDNPASLYEELSYICDHCQTLENGMQNMEQAWEQGREASEDLMRYHVLHPKICTDSRLATEYQRITAEKFEAKVVGDKKDMEKALSIVKGLFGGEVERLPVGKFQVLLENREQVFLSFFLTIILYVRV